VRLDLLDYDLPPELVATRPAAERDGARLLVVDPAADVREAPADRTIRDLPELVPPGALVVINDTRVLPARLLGRKRDTGGRVELLLLRRAGGPAPSARAERWEALGRASKGLRPEMRLELGEAGEIEASVVATGEGGLVLVDLSTHDGGPLAAAIESVGHVPLPPYLGRPDELEDRARYQTVFARVPGAVAAPTAGLHLTEALMARMRARGVAFGAVTLHVGLGTFQPVTVDDLDEHPMHAEALVVSRELATQIAEARERGSPVVAIGTTVVRALESAADPERPGHVRPLDAETRMLIQPGYAFRVVDALLTNFHLPRSTLLALVAAFAGRERVLDAYRTAVERGYRFFSYGDAMYLPRRAAS
jgi:S-adenosylmethionine:tRNA ribosyltransferase-isomerase